MFFAKLLLFGEYVILKGGSALSVPYPRFSGSLHFYDRNYHDENAIASNKVLRSFLDYAEKLKFSLFLNLEKFKKDIDNGLYFNSNIPLSYGVGSSGALTAAIYNKYGNNKSKINASSSNLVLNSVRNQLSQLESYFHGSSSGTDPLSSFIGKPLFINSKEIKKVSIPEFIQNQSVHIFTIDTYQKGNTNKLVAIFQNKMNQTGYNKKIHNDFIPVNDFMVESFINNRKDEFMEALHGFSELELMMFTEMIPKNFKAIWHKGLTDGSFILKLCGSGGGGYLLGFSMDIENTKRALDGYNIDHAPYIFNGF